MCLIVPPYDFYVYTLRVPKNWAYIGHARIFYVGKGVGIRVYAHEEEARMGCECRKCGIIRDVWARGDAVEKEIVFTSPNENDAYRHETALIRKVGRYSQLLCNRGYKNRTYIRDKMPGVEGKAADLWETYLNRPQGRTK